MLTEFPQYIITNLVNQDAPYYGGELHDVDAAVVIGHYTLHDLNVTIWLNTHVHGCRTIRPAGLQ